MISYQIEVKQLQPGLLYQLKLKNTLQNVKIKEHARTVCACTHTHIIVEYNTIKKGRPILS